MLQLANLCYINIINNNNNIAHSDAVISDTREYIGGEAGDTLLQSFNRVETENATLLGAPLFPGPALDRAWAERCEELAKSSRQTECH